MFLPVPQILEQFVEVVAFSELQVMERIQEQWRCPSSSSARWWTFLSAAETGFLRRASDSVGRVMGVPVVRASLALVHTVQTVQKTVESCG